jgi:tetratricopeptide (TPR) repeat protein
MRPMNRHIVLLTVSIAFVSAACLGQNATEKKQSSTPADLVKQGQQLSREGKQDEALAAYEQALQLDPNFYQAQVASGAALDLKGDYAAARQHLTKAIEIASPENKPQAWRAMAVSYAFEANAGEAAKYEQQAMDARLAQNDFAGAAGVANEQARYYLESGDLDRAYDWYKKGYETALRTPGLKDADKHLWEFRWSHAQARIAARRGQRDEAAKQVAAAKTALENANNPEQSRFFPYLTGYVAFYEGDYKTAVGDLQKADQSDPFILSLLAQAYEKSGDQAQAKDYYRKVLAINIHNPTGAFARPLAMKKLSSGS